MKVGLIGFFGVGAFSDDLINSVTQKLLEGNRKNVQFDSSLIFKAKRQDCHKILNKFDLIVHAGGSLLGKCEHHPVVTIDKWFDKVTTPFALFGTGYRHEPGKEPLNPMRRKRLHLLFKKSEVASVRGCITVRHLKKNGVDTSTINSVGDPVMACDIKLQKDPQYVMGNVRSPPGNAILHATNVQTQKYMASVYDWLIEYYDLPLVLLSFRHHPLDSDLVGAKRTMRFMKHSGRAEIVRPKHFMDAVTRMRHAKFWFGQRLHPAVFAATQGIPFVGVEYQFQKMMDWVSTVGIDNYIHTGAATLDNFIEKFEKVPENMRRLKTVLPERVKEIHAVADMIMELAE